MDTQPADKQVKTIQSIDRALNILECFDRGGEEIGVTALSKKLMLHKSTVFGILTTLARRGYLEQNKQTGNYKLGLKLFELGNLVLEGMDLKAAASPYLEQLVEQFGETAHLVIMDNGEVVYIDKRESPQSMRIVSQVGKRLPAHATGVGKCLLAYMPENELGGILDRGLPRFTENTLTDKDELKAQLSRIREAGYSLDNQEMMVGLQCVAAPIRDHSGNVIAAISVAGPSARIHEGEIKRIAPYICETAGQISAKLGG